METSFFEYIPFIIIGLVLFGALFFLRQITERIANYTQLRGDTYNEIIELKEQIKVLNEKLDTLINK